MHHFVYAFDCENIKIKFIALSTLQYSNMNKFIQSFFY